jgi:hypothetical protein
MARLAGPQSTAEFMASLLAHYIAGVVCRSRFPGTAAVPSNSQIAMTRSSRMVTVAGIETAERRRTRKTKTANQRTRHSLTSLRPEGFSMIFADARAACRGRGGCASKRVGKRQLRRLDHGESSAGLRRIGGTAPRPPGRKTSLSVNIWG